MGEVRQRKIEEKSGAVQNGYKADSKSRKAGKIQKTFICTTIVGIVLIIATCTTILNPLVESIASRLGYHERVYAVIIDAGSTGSRVLAYTFHKTYIGGNLILDDELFKEVSPGLSSYADNPKQVATSITPLLAAAHSVVPAKARAASPLLLRATAGLRLLPPASAQAILDAASHALATSGFLVTPNSVEIMDGADEGINSWFTVNFLQGRLVKGQTTAALDLGGGSTQVTYEPPAGGPAPTVSLPGPHGNISLYTQSYLKLGLMAVRRGVLLAENPEDATQLTSSCLNPVVQNKPWRYSNINYLVGGSQKDVQYLEVPETMISVSARVPVVKREHCVSILETVVRSLLPAQKAALQDLPVTAFSYYFDRCADAGLVDPLAGGPVKVSDISAAAEQACSTPNEDQPWACLDLSFIQLMLHEAFQIRGDKIIQLVKKINNHEISWALGLAYNTLVKAS